MGVNYFVGNNNCGKSSVFEAIEFVKNLNGRTKDDVISQGSPGDVSVTIEFRGDVEEAVKSSGLSKYESYITEDGGEKIITIKRSSREETIKQNGKDKSLGLRAVQVYNDKSKQYENPTGADKTIGALYETQFIWADTNPGDISDFGATKICGRLVAVAAKDFYLSPQWTTFADVHRDTFTKGKDSLASKIKPIEEKLQTIISEQYGDTEVKFDFSLPEASSFTKSGRIKLVDHEVETDSKEKGTGMQRALALALIQVYAESITSISDDETKKKPLLFFIDEPETFLHPKAQNKLMEALEVIAKSSQIFVTTHSPYLLKNYSPDTHNLYMFSKKKPGNQVKSSTDPAVFGASSPTWGEINYFAFNMPTVEFHNELYGFAQAQAILVNQDNEKEKEFDDYLESLGCTKSKVWKRSSTFSYPTTLQTYIRNSIHHPENKLNDEYTTEELEQSIKDFFSFSVPLK